MKKYLIYFCLSVLLHSCELISINGSLKGLYGYYKPTKKQIPSKFVQTINPKVYEDAEIKSAIIVTNGKVLLEQLKLHDTSIVYIWKPLCRSRLCISPTLIQQQCDRKKISLFIVAEYYDSSSMTRNYDIEYPITGIDTKYYHSNLTSRYVRKFLTDLTGKKPEDDMHHLLYFYRGTFLKSVETNEM